MGKENGKAKEATDLALPLFEYAKKFEDFASFDDFNHYFIHCLYTSGYKMSTIQAWMGFTSPTALSLRMDRANPENTHAFTTKHINLYVSNSGDPRPGQYLEWEAKRAQTPSSELLKERMAKLLPHITEIRKPCDILEGK